jgi:hypothetical protein
LRVWLWALLVWLEHLHLEPHGGRLRHGGPGFTPRLATRLHIRPPRVSLGCRAGDESRWKPPIWKAASSSPDSRCSQDVRGRRVQPTGAEPKTLVLNDLEPNPLDRRRSVSVKVASPGDVWPERCVQEPLKPGGTSPPRRHVLVETELAVGGPQGTLDLCQSLHLIRDAATASQLASSTGRASAIPATTSAHALHTPLPLQAL